MCFQRCNVQTKCQVTYTGIAQTDRQNADLLVLARKLLDLVLALGGVYRLADTAVEAGVRLDREEARCKEGGWFPPAEVGYMPVLLDAVTSSLAVAGLSPVAA